MKENIIILLLLAGLFLSGSAQKYENYQVEVLGKGLWLIQAVTGAQQSTAYLVEGKKEALLIDACSGQDGLADVLKDLVGKKRIKLALTHGHGDHSGGVKFFSEVSIHPADSASLRRFKGVKVHFIEEGYVFNLGGQKLEVISIPGHSPGSIAFYNKAGRYMMTGDGIGSTSVWAHISKDPLTVFLASCRKLEAFKDKVDAIYVGHHEQEKVKLTPQYITDMRIVTEKVLAGTIETRSYPYGGRGGMQATYGSATVVFNPDNLFGKIP
jgi:glyoxylase-like metal-dependent hydrolase (beta-lactamase superfamily II)